jgi:hypothetical protein
MAYCGQVIAASEKREGNFIVISGWWYNEIAVTCREEGNDPGRFAFYLTEEEMSAYKEKGIRIYYLSEQDRYNDEYSGINVTAQLAEPYDKEE